MCFRERRMMHNRTAWTAGNSWDAVLDDTDVYAIRWHPVED